MTAPTPGQTVGPFFHGALVLPGGHLLVPAGAPGAVLLHGRVLDGAGDPVPDALLELWQADPAGAVPRATGSLRRDGRTFTGFGRCATDDDGRYAFTTLVPGAVDAAPPFFALTLFARGLLHRLRTRAYPPLAAGTTDGVLTAAGARARTLLCVADDEGLRFDVHLQGPDETVFLGQGGD